MSIRLSNRKFLGSPVPHASHHARGGYVGAVVKVCVFLFWVHVKLSYCIVPGIVLCTIAAFSHLRLCSLLTQPNPLQK